jgi:hypothetical protein
MAPGYPDNCCMDPPGSPRHGAGESGTTSTYDSLSASPAPARPAGHACAIAQSAEA